MIKSYAKLNVFLNIVGRKNGFHLLESLFVYLDLFDELEISPANQNKLEILGDYKEILERDLGDDKWGNSLFAKTYQVFQEEFGIKDKFAISLKKTIPIGGGLGGGSSNAACFLKYLLKYYNINLDAKDQYKIAAKIGADCAFFMQDYARIISGVGDEIGGIIDFENFYVNLLNLGNVTLTKDVFAKYREISDGYTRSKLPELANMQKDRLTEYDIYTLSKNFQNDLRASFFVLNPNIKNHLEKFEIDTSEVFLSGSGSTLFFYNNEKKSVTTKEGYAKMPLPIKVLSKI